MWLHRQTVRSAKTYHGPNTCTQMPYHLYHLSYTCLRTTMYNQSIVIPRTDYVQLRAEPIRANSYTWLVCSSQCHLFALCVCACEVANARNYSPQCSFSNHSLWQHLRLWIRLKQSQLLISGKPCSNTHSTVQRFLGLRLQHVFLVLSVFQISLDLWACITS